MEYFNVFEDFIIFFSRKKLEKKIKKKKKDSINKKSERIYSDSKIFQIQMCF